MSSFPKYKIEFRHNARPGVEKVFITIKPKWGPYREEEMVHLKSNTFSGVIEIDEEDRYHFHEVPYKKMALGRVNFGYSLKDQMLKVNPIHFEPKFPFIESFLGKQYVRIQAYPNLFSHVTLRLDVNGKTLDFSQEIVEFARWEIDLDDEITSFRFIFKSADQNLYYPDMNDPAFQWRPTRYESLVKDLTEENVFHLQPDLSFSNWLEQLDRYAEHFSAVLLPPFFKSEDFSSYQVADYFKVDESRGGWESLFEVVNWIRSRSKKLIIDWPFRFCSHRHHWYSFTDDQLTDPDRFEFDANGKIKFWSMNPHCPLLSWSSQKNRDDFISIMSFWEKELGIWGHRIDCAHEIHTDCYQMFLNEAKINGLENIFGEAWNYDSPVPRSTSYSLPLFMQNHPLELPSLPILLRLLDRFYFESGLIQKFYGLNYYSSHDTEICLLISKEMKLAFFILSLFLPGSYVYYVKDLEEILPLLENVPWMSWKTKFKSGDMTFRMENDSIVMTRPPMHLIYSLTAPKEKTAFEYCHRDEWWLWVGEEN
jgi:hypothetical protein